MIVLFCFFFFFNDTATTEIYTLSLHDALPICVLRMNEVFNLKLAAELVVRSACQTGLGRVIRGEGMVGLTRAFLYAGSPRVAVSLWKVSDLATPEFMRAF